MKKIMLIMLIAISGSRTSAQQADTSMKDLRGAEINISEYTFDFGAVPVNTSVTRQIQYQNSGDMPLIIADVQIAPLNTLDPESHIHITWTKKAVKPGKKGLISITYTALDETGSFHNHIVIKTGKSETFHCYISGAVIPVSNHFEKDYVPLTLLGAVVGAIIINNAKK